VVRTGARFGVGHVVEVLRGANTERIRNLQHDQLSTYGLLEDIDKKSLTNLVYQLVDQGLLERSGDEMPVLRLNAASWEVMRGQCTVRLREPKSTAVKRTRFDTESWEGVDRGLFEHLRALRREIADERGVPPFVIFSDASLRDMARTRPGSRETFVQVHGVGERKLQDLGPSFLEQTKAYCGTHGLSLDVSDPNVSRPVSKPRRKSKLSDS